MENYIRHRQFGWSIGIVLIVWLGLGSCADAADCDKWVARVVAVDGKVERQTSTSDWIPLRVEEQICTGDSVRVGADSRAALYLSNNSFVRLDANSLLHFPEKSSDTDFWVELNEGIAHFISRIIHRFQVSTPYVNAVVEGTEFIVSAQHQQGAVSVVEGKVRTFNAKATEMVTANQQVRTAGPDQPIQRFDIPASGQVQWAIYYPPVLTLSQLQPSDVADRQRLHTAIQHTLQNRPDLALDVLDVTNPGPALQVARAALLLAVGRVDTFDSVVESVLNTAQAAEGYSLKAIADAARDRSDVALAEAGKAVALAPGKASGYIALSYAQQSALQLGAALKSARQAVRVEPGNTLARLRLSEMFLAKGDIGAAGDALKSIGEDPLLAAQVENAKGFVALFSLYLDSAEKHFRNALEQAPGNPQSHLGLGLTLLRKGELAEGRRQLEYAVSLDPLRSTLRSYLGRAYFAEKRDKEAIKQWRLARQYDPNDPTPYFYTGVYNLFQNDPVAAIAQLEQSRELNDKRAVYRSETLLQSDAASRSATLARAYNAVGYQEGVLLNGWDAIRRDPTNAEGHRLLADMYANDPRYESARVSELLQSQLWQPVNAYPLQPQLSETDLSAIAGAGPQRPGLNEYHTLFNRDGGYGTFNGYGGSDGTWGNDLVGSVLAGPYAASVGQYHYESDGWRDDASQKQDIYSGMLQAQLSPVTRIQYEHRYVNWDKGDLTPRWDGKQTTYPYDNSKRITNRFGWVQGLTSNDTLVFSALGQRVENEQAQLSDQNSGSINLDRTPQTYEGQIVSLRNGYHFIYGGGSTRLDEDQNIQSVFNQFDGTGLPTYITVDVKQHNILTQHQRNLYAYLNSTIGPGIVAVLGLSYDQLLLSGELKQDTVATTSIPLISYVDVSQTASANRLDNSLHQWSPKFGVSIKPLKHLQFRVAAYRALSHSFAANQTIEPASIVGFSQFYSDRDGLKSDNYAVAMDYDRGAAGGVGASWIRRLLEGPVIDSTGTQETKSSETMLNFYFRSSPFHWMSYSLAYQYSQLLDNYFVDVTDGVPYARSYSVPLELRFFVGDSWSFRVRDTYYKHSFDYADGVGTLNRNARTAYVADFGMDYRLGKRLGILSAGVQNAADKKTEIAQFKEAGVSYLGYYPGRMLYLKFNLNL